MIYPIIQLLSGYSLKDAWTLWKTKLRLFNPRTYEMLRLIKWWSIVQCEKIALWINKKIT